MHLDFKTKKLNSFMEVPSTSFYERSFYFKNIFGDICQIYKFLEKPKKAKNSICFAKMLFNLLFSKKQKLMNPTFFPLKKQEENYNCPEAIYFSKKWFCKFVPLVLNHTEFHCSNIISNASSIMQACSINENFDFTNFN